MIVWLRGNARLLSALSLFLSGCVAPNAITSIDSPDGSLRAVILRHDEGATGESHSVALADRKGNERRVFSVDGQRFLRVEWRDEETLAIRYLYGRRSGGSGRSYSIDGRRVRLEVDDFDTDGLIPRRRYLRLLPTGADSSLNLEEDEVLVFRKSATRLQINGSAEGDTLVRLWVHPSAESVMVQHFSAYSTAGVGPIFSGLVCPGESAVEGQATPLGDQFALKSPTRLILVWTPRDTESGIFPISVSMRIVDDSGEPTVLDFEIRDSPRRED